MLKKAWQTDKRKVKKLVESKSFDMFIMSLICMDALILGFVYSGVFLQFSTEMFILDRLCMAIFIIEMLMKIYAYGPKFYKSGWNVFDFTIVAVSSVSLFSYFIILRVFRLFRILKYVGRFDRMKNIINTFLMLAPNFLAVFGIFALFFYVYAIMAVSLFGETFGARFGCLGDSLFTLMQVFTLDGWAEIARPVMMVSPWSWLFFISFIFLSYIIAISFIISIIAEQINSTSGKKYKIKNRL
ncbi:MAG: ion transporter [Lactobacillus sp.]|jgi:voltage-gated sodium channel|nr:ion transporter [Lactobacillus sp.]